MRVGAFLGGEEGLRELTVGGMQLIVQGGGGACDKNPQILNLYRLASLVVVKENPQEILLFSCGFQAPEDKTFLR